VEEEKMKLIWHHLFLQRKRQSGYLDMISMAININQIVTSGCFRTHRVSNGVFRTRYSASQNGFLFCRNKTFKGRSFRSGRSRERLLEVDG